MIEVTLKGRLGNQMFQYAMCRSVAEKNGYEFFVNPDMWVGGMLFNLSMGGRFGWCTDLTTEFIEGDHRYYPEVWDIPDQTRLIGYFQSEKYFDHAKARRWFDLCPDKEATAIGLKYPTEEYCYINLRGTDVKELGCQKLSLEYYRNAIDVINCVNPGMKFLVITDDIPFGHEYFPDFPVISNSVRTDFTLLKSAKYIILADSSFAWWAAWLNENNFAIAPQGWLNVNINKWISIPRDIKVLRWLWI